MPVELPTEIVSYALLFKSISIFKYVGFTLESMVTLPRFVLFVTISSDVKSIVALLNDVFTDNKLLLSIFIILSVNVVFMMFKLPLETLMMPSIVSFSFIVRFPPVNDK